ncbi:protein kinase domain-containing protein [Frankia nepalensis]|uniref:protein kinase domain-containing protein n=2 Tax=Frankia nepalensis TaxID=1836974 RepID=UPI0027DB1C7B|nr:protein kinase [Frankia nepalensis]
MTELPAGVTPLGSSDPRQLGAYTLLGRLGRGGMGNVYLARRTDSADGPFLAVKVIRSDMAGETEFRRRFVREAQAARRVARSYTAAVLDVGTDAAQPYLVTEYIDGPTLAAHVQAHGPLPPAQVEWLAEAVASALRAIHAAGVVHRDLKPSNILLSRFGARVIDFGVARALDSATIATQGAIGTPAYMAPEQALGEAVTGAADVHALGAVLVFAATGKSPFGADSVPRIMGRIATEPPDLTGVPDMLRPLVAQTMAKAPADRPTPDELLVELHRLRTGSLPIPAIPTDGAEPATRTAPARMSKPAPAGLPPRPRDDAPPTRTAGTLRPPTPVPVPAGPPPYREGPPPGLREDDRPPGAARRGFPWRAGAAGAAVLAILAIALAAYVVGTKGDDTVGVATGTTPSVSAGPASAQRTNLSPTPTGTATTAATEPTSTAPVAPPQHTSSPTPRRTTAGPQPTMAPPQPPDGPPSAPADLFVAEIGSDVLRVTWTNTAADVQKINVDAVASPCQSYNSRYCTDRVMDTLPASATSYTFTGLRAGTDYYISIWVDNATDSSDRVTTDARTLQ